MADDVTLPGIGPVSKKALVVTGVVAGGVLAYAYYRHSKTASAATTAPSATTSAGTVTDPAGNVCAALDPNSGYCPGTAQDLAYQESEGTGENGLGDSDIDPQTGYVYGSPQDEAALATLYGTGSGTGTSSTSSTSTATVTTNAEWEQECIANLQAGGVDATTIANAESGLPRYLAKLSLSSAQATAVQLAVGLTGEPPVGGPFSIITAPSSPGGTGGTGTANVTVPALSNGTRVEDANSALKALGLTSTLSESRKAGVAYYVIGQSPKAGTSVAVGSNVKLTISTKP